MLNVTDTKRDKMKPDAAKERELRRRLVEAVRDGDEALAWKLLREYCGLPPEKTQ